MAEATGELKLLYKKIEKSLGFIPLHFELFATLDLKSLGEFVSYNLYFANHPNIDANILPILRLCIAQKECRSYCINFNTKILQETGIEKELLKDICKNIEKLPFDSKQILLLSKVLYAIYNPQSFGIKDLEEIYNSGFSDKDFYELLSYGTNFMAKSKMIEVYLK
jgi:alkylhydroperoxidase family enzyme